MHYEGIIIRPPSEAGSLILQLSTGCSHNRCTFCPTYKAQKYRVKNLNTVFEDIREAASYQSGVSRVFIADGDALSVPFPILKELFIYINRFLTHIERIAIYANAKSIRGKTDAELKWLKNNGLGIVYMGIESGDDDVLYEIKKGADSSELLEQGLRVMKAGLKLSVTMLLGIAGEEGSVRHAQQSGLLLSELSPDFIGVLTLMISEGTPLFRMHNNGQFRLPEPLAMLSELRKMLANTNVSKSCLFTSNHASNYIPLKLKLPLDKQKGLEQLDTIIKQSNNSLLKPEWLRGL